jgi:hypothetical protein
VLHSSIFEEKLLSNTVENMGLYETIQNNLVDSLTVAKEDFIDKDSQLYSYKKEEMEAEAEKYATIINNAIGESINSEVIKSKIVNLEGNLLVAIQEEKEFNFSIDYSDVKSSILNKFDEAFANQTPNEAFHNEVRSQLTKLPSEMNLKELGLNLERLDSLKAYYKDYNEYNQLLLIAALALFAIGALISLTTKNFFRWTGSSVTSIGVSILFSYIIAKYSSVLLEKLNIAIPQASNGNMENGITYITTTIANEILPFAIIVLGTGLVLLAISFIPKFSPKQVKAAKTA